MGKLVSIVARVHADFHGWRARTPGQRLRRRRGAVWLVASVTVMLVGLTARQTSAQQLVPLMTNAELHAFTSRVLPPPTPGAVEAALGPAAPLLRGREGIELRRYHLASLEAAECVMQRAADRQMNIAQLFTDSRFGRGGGMAIVIDQRRLEELDRLFDFHSIFPVRATTRDGRPIRMLYLLAGEGRLVVGYDRGGEIEHEEPAYRLHGGRYDLAPLIAMNIDSAAAGGGRRGFSGIRTLPDLRAAAPFGDFMGPKGSRLQGLVVTPQELIVKAKLSPWLLGMGKDLRVAPPPIARRKPPGQRETAALLDRGCPRWVPWATGAWRPTPAAIP